MAVDTAQKRAVLLSFISPIPMPPFIDGDGTIDAFDRAGLGGLYVDSAWGASNSAPVEDSAIPNTDFAEGQVVNWDISVHFSDPDLDNLSFALAPSSGALPTNLSLSSAGVISGTLNSTDTAGSPYNGIVIRVTDDGTPAQSIDSTAFNITVTVAATGGNVGARHSGVLF